MFGADTKVLFAQYFPEGQTSTFSVHCLAHLYTTSGKKFFGFCCKLSYFLAIIDGYYIWLSSDWTI